ncbi:DUF2586 family protein [bacterium]|nr:DUF2586 family protein [bacterium]
MGEPRIETEYEDNFQSDAPTSLEHRILLMGLGSDGPLHTKQTFSGMSGVAAAEEMFGTSQRLPRAVRESISAAVLNKKPLTVDAIRCGDGAQKASFVWWDNGSSAAFVSFEYEYTGDGGNDWQFMAEEGEEEGDYVASLRRGEDGDVTQFEGTKEEIVEAVNDSSLSITATAGGGETADLPDWTDFEGGTNGTWTGDELILALDLAKDEKTLPLLLTLDNVGEGDDGLREALATHAADMLTSQQVERLVVVELKAFETENPVNSSAWREDVQAWVDGLIEETTGEAYRELIGVAGQRTYTDGDGEEYVASTAAQFLGAWFAENINRSPVNILVQNGGDLEPEIPVEMRNDLADARISYLRTEEGRGVIIGNDRTLAENTSDFKYAEVIRTIFTCGMEAREAGKVIWGQPNDPDTNDGLAALRMAMEKPLENRMPNSPSAGRRGTIAGYESDVTQDAEGDVDFDMGILNTRTMRRVRHRVHVERS